MRKMIALSFIFLVLFAGCGNADSNTVSSETTTVSSIASTADGKDKSDSSDDVVVIKEKMFIAQTNDIYYNANDYLGKTIQYEGLFDIYEIPDEETHYFVIRYGPGCCGNDGYAGFEVNWEGEYPNKDDWVEVTGVLEEYDDYGLTYLRLHIVSLTTLTTRGAEFVSQ